MYVWTCVCKDVCACPEVGWLVGFGLVAEGRATPTQETEKETKNECEIYPRPFFSSSHFIYVPCCFLSLSLSLSPGFFFHNLKDGERGKFFIPKFEVIAPVAVLPTTTPLKVLKRIEERKRERERERERDRDCKCREKERFWKIPDNIVRKLLFSSFFLSPPDCFSPCDQSHRMIVSG